MEDYMENIDLTTLDDETLVELESILEGMDDVLKKKEDVN